MSYAGIKTSKMCSQLWPWANNCSTSWSKLCNASRAIVRTFCPMVMAPCANANLSVSAPEAGACWSSDCATQLGSVSKVEMAALIALLYKALFPSISTFETPPTTQPEVALDRFLLAHLSRLQAAHLLAELMKDF